MGDVVRFTSIRPPRILYVGRTKLQLSAFGEHVIERDITEALLTVCRHNGWTIVNFHVAPNDAGARTGPARGRHEWWIELRSGTLTTPKAPQIEAALDAELMRMNDDYDAQKAQGSSGVSNRTVVHLVMHAGFSETLDAASRKMGRPEQRCPAAAGDRLIADELGAHAAFCRRLIGDWSTRAGIPNASERQVPSCSKAGLWVASTRP